MTLPELSESASPEFTDAASCRAWLEHLPLSNVAAAQAQIARELRELNRFPVSATQRLSVLEALREAVNFVQIEQARRFSNRALPMNESEAEAFAATIGLWDEMRQGYERCLQGAANLDAAMRAQAVIVCQRLLFYIGLRMFHHHRAYREVPRADWRALHAADAGAEKLGVAEEPIKDFLNRDIQDTSPRIAYARAVLTALCNPNELTQRQLTFVAFLLERWASKLEVGPKPVAEDDGVPPLVADLAGDAPPARSSATARDARYLDTRKLAKTLRNRVALLRKGESPAKLALGEDCVQPSCEQLLVHLYRQWCAARTPRAPERRAGGPAAELCSELPAISHYISGRAFRTPGEPQSELTQKQREEIATFGRVSTRTEEDYSGDHGFAIEQWQIEDQSAQGLRLVRPASQGGKRLAHGQLVAVRPADGKQFMLAQVRWLMAGDNGDLHVGGKLIPGKPTALAVRPTGLNVQQESWIPALALSASPALNSPASLVLALGLYKPKRVIELHAEGASRVRLTEVLERGADFERVAYEPVP